MLTDHEAMYAYYYSYTSNNTKALIDSGLDAGLQKPRSKGSTISYDNALKMRGYFLRGKPNVKEYIIDLRKRKLSDMNCDTQYVQSTLVQQIEFMQEESDPRMKTNLLRAVELLGKTIPGTFSETIKIEEVRPDEALDTLLEMAKKAAVTKVTTKDTVEEYEVIND